jgi:large subunit ribosomal protein L30
VARPSKNSSPEREFEYDYTTNCKVQLVRSPIGCKESHRATVRGLGLRKLNSTSELQDTPAVRGMINKISYLVKVL